MDRGRIVLCSQIRHWRLLMAAKFEVFQAKDGKFHFRLKAANGEIIAQSQGYSTKANCTNGIESVKKNAASAEVVEVQE
jgi:uncharacterized protein YegP (UPF0339 family)